MKVLYFEGAGWSGADISRATIGNCRIRTAFHLDNGRAVYLEIIGSEKTKYSSPKIHKWQYTGFVDACFYITDEKPNDDQNKYSICLGRPEDDNYTGILKLLEVLLSSERDPSEKKKILEEGFSIKMTKQLEGEVSVMCNLSEDVEQRGIAKGFAQGMAQGIAQGKEEGTLWHIQSLMRTLKLTVEQAMDALQIPKSERAKYVELLNK